MLYAIVCLILSNAFCLTSVHLNFIFLVVSVVRGFKICKRFSHTSWKYYINPINLSQLDIDYVPLG